MYVDFDGLTDFLKFEDNFTVFSLNIQSIHAKFDEFKIMIDQLALLRHTFNAICLQETWLDADSDTVRLQIEGYNFISRPKSCSLHGGLAIYLKEEYSHSEIDICPNSELWENQTITVSGPNLHSSITLSNIYRPPRNNDNNTVLRTFLSEYTILVEGLSKFNHDCAIVGDFNINLLRLNEREVYNEYFDLMVGCGFFPHITLPTRFSRKSCSLLDQIFVKEKYYGSLSKSVILFSNLSDHLPCVSSIGKSLKYTKENREVFKRKMNHDTVNAFAYTAKSTDFRSICHQESDRDPNENCDIIDSTLSNAMDATMPLQRMHFDKYKHKRNAWVTSGILRSIKYRDKLYLNMKRAKNSHDYDTLCVNLKAYNRILRKMIREAKHAYFTQKFNETKVDMKKSWTILKNMLNNRQKNTTPMQFFHNNAHLKDPLNISEQFNYYFSNIGSDIADVQNAKLDRRKYLEKVPGISFRFTPVTECVINKTIQNLTSKNSSGVDGLSTKLLKLIREQLLPALSITINQSFCTGIFPSRLKLALVKPLYKKGNEQLFQNYRPISLLPAISKVFEKIAHRQVYDYFLLHKLLYDSQYGFRENHSTEHAAIELTDLIISNLDKGKLPIAIFLDFSKAFDMIDHEILLEKLQKYGFENESLKWFHSYLSERSQCVEYGGHRSSFLPLDKGVPQGSVLGPLLFLIYINDIHNCCKTFKCILYADDTTLTAPICSFTNSNSISEEINNTLHELWHWLQINKLQLNVGKSKFMIFHFRQRKLRDEEIPEIKINNTPIQRVSEFNFLGLMLDESLNWNAHVNKISNKISKIIGIMNKQKRILPTRILKLMYDSFILPHINYCISCWGFNMKRITKLQKRALRVICLSKYNAHTDPLFKQLNILKAADLFHLSHLKLHHKFVNNKLPAYISEMLTFNRHSYNTRSQLPARTFSRTTSGTKRVKCHIIKILDSTERIILEKVNTHSLSGFCQYFRRQKISSYQSDCTIEGCYICRN